MIRRSLLVRALLAALSACAVAGVAAVFAQNSNFAERVALTSGVVVAACAALLPVATPAHAARVAALHLVITAWITVAVALFTLMIWSGRSSWLWANLQLDVLPFAWVGYGTGSLIVARAPLQRRVRRPGEPWRPSERVQVAGAALAMVVGTMLQLRLAGSGAAQVAPAHFLLTLAATIATSCCAASLGATTKHFRPGPLERVIAIAGIALTLLSAGIWMHLTHETLVIAGPGASTKPWIREVALGTALSSLACAAALWCVLRPLHLPGPAGLLAPGIVALTLSLGTLLTMAPLGWMQAILPNETGERVIMAVAILEAAMLLAAGLVWRARHAAPAGVVGTEPIASMRLDCPRCGVTRDATRGESACRHCGLAVLIDFRDDRCPACGYDLQGRPAGSCPECGRARQMPTGA